MDKIKKQESTIIRLTRWKVEVALSKKKSSKEHPQNEICTIYGIDEEGKETVYAQLPYKRFKKWSKTNSLWRQAQSSMFRCLLSDPRTRNTLIRINLRAALEKGDEDAAIRLWNAMSVSDKVEFLDKPEA
jgi:hypothetical protein